MTSKELNRLLAAIELSQRSAARLIGINERTMRRYCAGESRIPRVVELALTCLVQHKDGKP